MKTIYEFISNEEGASMAEYALLVGLVAVGVIAAITAFRNNMRTTFDNAGTAINGAQ